MSSQNYGIPSVGASAGTVPSNNNFTSTFVGTAGDGIETNPNGYIDGTLLEPNCIQTKFLPADVTSDQFITSLGFNNLTIGKYYQLIGSFLHSLTVSDGTTGARIIGVDPSASIFSRFGVNPVGASPQLSSAEGQFAVVTPIFEAFVSSLQVETIFQQAGDSLRGNGTFNETWLQLIEYKRGFTQVTTF